MSCDWPMVRLGEYCRKIGSGATPKGGKETYLDTGPFALIRSQNVYNDGFHDDGLAFISEEQARKLDGVTVEADDVLINITGDSVARVCLAPARVLPARVNQHVAIIRPDPSEFDSRFLRYFLVTPVQQELLLGLAAAGATRKALTKGMLENFAVPKPPLEVQKELVEPLHLLEQRIELLRDTNATLESVAQALFKSWFIDFDPVRAKAEGRDPEGMDAETAALFPSEFEESELGPVPQGWQGGSFGDLASLFKKTINPQGQPSVEFEHYSIPAFDAGQLPVIERGDSIKSNKAIVPPGAVLVSKLNPHIPRVWFPGDIGEHAICSTEFLPWVPRAGVSREYLYCLLRSPSFTSAVQSLVTGTSNSHQRVNAEQIAMVPLVIPPGEVRTAFEKTVAPILARTVRGRYQGQTLAALRDELLPRLISGRSIRVPEAQEAIEEALV